MTAVVPSRPLRSLAIFLMAWVLVRALTIWSDAIPQGDVQAAPSATATIERVLRSAARSQGSNASVFLRAEQIWIAKKPKIGPPSPKAPTVEQPDTPNGLLAGPITAAVPAPVADSGNPVKPSVSIVPATIRAISPASTGSAHDRWSGSAWLLLRGDGPNGLGATGQLGGAQAGARIFYDLDGRVSATARVSRALSRAQGGEASIGISIRHRNVGLLLERRVALDRGGRNEFSATAYGGFSDVAVTRDIRVDGYAQAGIVGTDKFVDGAVRVERKIVTANHTSVSAGAGVWGGAQPGVERIDIGPQIVARIPAEGRTLRVSAEWRERIAGKADPGSGLSVTLGIDL